MTTKTKPDVDLDAVQRSCADFDDITAANAAHDLIAELRSLRARVATLEDARTAAAVATSICWTPESKTGRVMRAERAGLHFRAMRLEGRWTLYVGNDAVLDGVTFAQCSKFALGLALQQEAKS